MYPYNLRPYGGQRSTNTSPIAPTGDEVLAVTPTYAGAVSPPTTPTTALPSFKPTDRAYLTRLSGRRITSK